MSRRSNNTGRSDAARFALRSYQWAKSDWLDPDEEDPDALIDLLADLRHFCDTRGVCYADYDRIACDHYDEERRASDAWAEVKSAHRSPLGASPAR